MELHSDIDNKGPDLNKPFAAKTCKPHFYDEYFAYFNIDPEIIRKLHLTSHDSFTQELTDNGTIIIRKVSKT